MGGALRELIALFGISYDAKGAIRANRDLDKLGSKATKTQGPLDGVGKAAKRASKETAILGKALGGLTAFFGVQQLARRFFGVVEAASDVNETLNVIQANFGDAADKVLEFSAKSAKAMGRSQYMMREFAGTIGSVVTPMLSELGDEASSMSARISTDFSMLAVDLASFFNTTEEEALQSLRSGLVGSTEPLLKFGVVALQKNLQEFAGISAKAFSKLSESEKVMLRYNFIMSKTTAAQGDAAKTADGYANASRALKERFRELAVVIGTKLLPFVEKGIAALNGFVKSISDTIQGTKVLEALMLVGSIAALAFGFSFLRASKMTLKGLGMMTGKGLLWGVVLTALFFAIDDVLTAMDGGDSYFGEWIDGLTGVNGSAIILKESLIDLQGAMVGLLTGDTATFSNFARDWIDGLKSIYDEATRVLKPIKTLINLALMLTPIGGLMGVFTGKGAVDNIGIILDKLRDLTGDESEENLQKRGLTRQRGVDTLSTRSAGGRSQLVGREAFAPLPKTLQIPQGPIQLPEYPALVNGPMALPDSVSASHVTSFNESRYRDEINNDNRSNSNVSNVSTKNANQTTNITVNMSGMGGRSARETGMEVNKAIKKALQEERRKVATGVGR